jgi:hypothetical protein
LLDVPSRVGGGSMLIGSMWVSQPSKVLVAWSLSWYWDLQFW